MAQSYTCMFRCICAVAFLSSLGYCENLTTKNQNTLELVHVVHIRALSNAGQNETKIFDRIRTYSGSAEIIYIQNTCKFIIVEDDTELPCYIFRHGDRTPDRKNVYPTDPYINHTYYPNGYGELTKKGKLKEYLLGKSLRKRYNNFLGSYVSSVVEGRSTYMNRTKASLELVLAGLFPPSEEEMFYKGLRWQPIPYTAVARNSDPLLGFPELNCPAYARELQQYKTTAAYLKVLKKHEELFSYLTAHMGRTINSTFLVQEMMFTLNAEVEHDLELPKWTNSVYPDAMMSAVGDEYILRTATKKLKMLSSGHLMKRILDVTKQKLEGKAYTERKIFLYSAHEHTVAHMLCFLGVYGEPHIPPYGSYIIFEVHRLPGNYGIKVFYQNYATKKPQALRLPGCALTCPIEKFMQIYGDQLPHSETACD